MAKSVMKNSRPSKHSFISYLEYAIQWIIKIKINF